MAKEETPDQVRAWFLKQAAQLWPLAGGSLSLRRNRCIRPSCRACQGGEGHPSYALYLRHGRRRVVVYVPDALAETFTTALANGQQLQALVREAGVRYLKALKARRPGP